MVVLTSRLDFVGTGTGSFFISSACFSVSAIVLHSFIALVRLNISSFNKGLSSFYGTVSTILSLIMSSLFVNSHVSANLAILVRNFSNVLS